MNNKKIRRNIADQLVDEINRKEISILLGPRQVGKTFLLNEILKIAKKQGLRVKSFNLEIPADLVQFNKPEIELFNDLTKDIDVLFLDEFHYIKNASKLFKAIYDSKKNVKIFASGSSSIEIHKHLKESLAGRRLISRLHPLSYNEFLQTKIKDPYDNYLLYGGLPGLTHFSKNDEKIRLLNEMLETYIQKDIKSLIREENIRAFNTLLYLLAENQGSVTVVNNLSRNIGLTSKSINHHLSILEHTYVVFPVSSYAKNIGNELKKAKKYYFYDLGIRNILLKDFSSLKERNDIGTINESFIFLQLQHNLKPNMEIKFWRNKQGHEIDFILLKNRKPFIIEVKTNINKLEIPNAMKIFIKHYPETIGGIVFNQSVSGEIRFLDKTISFIPHHEINNFIKSFFHS
ncbi:MAG: ATP-binding protein [Spirochaetes bacterium]|nr:ATP-binding protein [Spirochaetota bacterium]